MLLTGGFVVVVSALATITYGRFALPLIPLLAALGAAAAMQPGPRR
jgi:hypothetical protein